MSRAGRTSVLVLLACSCALPDSFLLTRLTVDGHETNQAQYAHGRKLRFEIWDTAEAEHLFTIYDLDQHITDRVNPRLRAYDEYRPQQPDMLISFAMFLTRQSGSGKTVNIYYETVDTGESKTFFGMTARHLMLIERHVADPGACERSSEQRKDGWYIQSRRIAKIAYSGYLVAGNCRDKIVRHGSPQVGLLAVSEQTGDVTRELLDFSDAPLPDSLFEVPHGFKKVEHCVTWSDRLGMEWSALEQAVNSWFE